jgi:hypothetical protein
MRYRLRTLLICSSVGAGSGALALLCYGFKEHIQGFPLKPLGYVILATYGGLIGVAVGLATGLLSRERTNGRHYHAALYAVIAVASIGAAFFCLPFTAPKELLDLMLEAQP